MKVGVECDKRRRFKCIIIKMVGKKRRKRVGGVKYTKLFSALRGADLSKRTGRGERFDGEWRRSTVIC